MKTQKFSKKEALHFGWNTMKKNIKFFIVLLIIVGLSNIIPNILDELVGKNYFFLLIITSVVFWILSTIIQIGLIKIALKFCDHKKGKIKDLFSQYRFFPKYLIGSILYSLIVFGGIILLVIPGIIWGIKFRYFGYFIIDQKLSPIEALKKSAQITKGAKWDLFLFSLLLGLINLLGFICLFVGLFTTIPTTMVAKAFVYRKLLNKNE